MQYIYHRKPADFRGTKIYPLNELRLKFSELHAAEASKYAGREQIMRETVPVVDVLWNDLVHCAPIHPHRIYAALRELDSSPEAQEYFRIPVAKLVGLPTVWFDPQNERYPFPVRSEEVTALSFDRYTELTSLPSRTLQYYRACINKGQPPPLLFLYIPHVLVHGDIDVSDVDVVNWSR